jgi:EAL domain-containing protein (putative c-di-GMP-specific phosphodiesterase class I)
MLWQIMRTDEERAIAMMVSNPARGARLYRNISLIECADAATLAEVLAGPAGRHVVRQLSETVVVVDHTQAEPILKALRKAGYTPRIIGEGRQ